MDIETRDFVVCKDGVLVTIFCLFLHSVIWYADRVNNILSVWSSKHSCRDVLSLYVNIFKILYTIIIIK